MWLFAVRTGSLAFFITGAACLFTVRAHLVVHTDLEAITAGTVRISDAHLASRLSNGFENAAIRTLVASSFTAPVACVAQALRTSRGI